MTEITVEELKSRIDSGEQLNLLDVREPNEHAEFNIGGKLFPLGNIQSFQLEDIEDLKDEEVLVYCRSGNRSRMACIILEQAGFKNVQNIVGGMLAWQEKFAK